MAPSLAELKALFLEAVALPREGREAWLEALSARSPEVATELRALLAADESGERDWLARGLGGAALAVLEGESRTGARLGRYRLGEELGRGGMGVVYAAERADGEYAQGVAIKVLRHALASEPERARFRRERQILATLEHPNIARLLDGGTSEQGEPYLVMERIAGQKLSELTGALDRATALRLVRELCGALAYAHRRLVIHRDLKPSNILVGEDGRAILLDFGIAKLLAERDTHDRASGARMATQAGETALGQFTERYASPEQRRGESVTTATDVYSLGLVLSELLTSDLPSEAGLRALPRDLAAIVRRATAELPEQRYATIDAFAADLDAYVARRPVVARGRGLAYRTGRLLARRWGVVAALTGVLAATAASASATYRARREAGAVQHIAQRVEQTAHVLRLARMVPAHDVRADERRALLASEELVRDAARGGEVARRHALLARGRIALLLGRDAEARAALGEAERLGLAHDELDVPLGLAYAEGYRRAVELAERIRDEGERTLRRERAQREFGERATAHLARAQAPGEAPYARGVLALVRGEYAAARAAAELALVQTPWLYEAWVLHGDAFRAEAAAQRKDPAAALATLAHAAESYARASSLAPSAPDAAVAACVAEERALVLHAEGKSVPGVEASYRAGRSACDRALALDPERVDARLAYATLVRGWAIRARDGQGGEEALFAEAARHAERARAAAPRDVEPLLELARNATDLAESDRRVNRDPRATLARATAALEQARALAPEDPLPVLLLGVTAAIGAQYGVEHLAAAGLPRAELEAGDRHLAWFIAHAPSEALEVRARNELALNKLSWALAEEDAGRDPAPYLTEGLDELARALALDPAYSKGWNNRAALSWVGAFHAYLAERDPEPFVVPGLEANARALALRPGYAMALYGQGRFHLLRARHVLERELSVRDAAADARALAEIDLAFDALARSQEIRPWASTLLTQAIAHRTLALHAERRGEDPRPHWLRADALLGKARALDKPTEGVLDRSSDLALQRAAYECRRGQSGGALFEQAQRFADAMPETRGRARRRGLVALARARCESPERALAQLAVARAELSSYAAKGPLAADADVARVEVELVEAALRERTGGDATEARAAAEQALGALAARFPDAPALPRLRAELEASVAAGRVARR